MIQIPCKMIVDAKGSVFHGKEVKVFGFAMILNGERMYDCSCIDGSGGGMIPEFYLKPIEE